MNKCSLFRTLFFTLGLLLFASCSVSPNNTDLLEYGYKGTVKSVKSTTYYDLTQKNNEWIIDDSKIGSIRTITFNEDGNIVKSVTSYPEYPDDIETTYFQFKNGRKIGFLKLSADKDTLEKAIYEWISETEYNFSSVHLSGRTTVSTSKLNSNFRDISGGYTFLEGDSILYANSYINTLAKNNLITKIDFTNEVTKEKSVYSMSYSDFDKMKNPLKLEMVDKEKGVLENLTIREFHYYE